MEIQYLLILDYLLSCICICIQYTLYKYLCQTCQTCQSQSVAGITSAKPGIRSFPVCQKSDTSRNSQIKIKINSLLGFYFILYFCLFGSISSTLGSFQADRQPFVCGNLLPPDCSDLLFYLFYSFILLSFFIYFWIPCFGFFFYYFSFLGNLFSRLQGYREV